MCGQPPSQPASWKATGSGVSASSADRTRVVDEQPSPASPDRVLAASVIPRPSERSRNPFVLSMRPPVRRLWPWALRKETETASAVHSEGGAQSIEQAPGPRGSPQLPQPAPASAERVAIEAPDPPLRTANTESARRRLDVLQSG